MALGSLALDLSPVVIQVPDFGDRFWVYQIVDLRTDGFVQLGKMYGTTPGFYLLVGPDWQGRHPQGHHQGLPLLRPTPASPRRASFQDDTPEDKQAIQSVSAPDHDVSAGRVRRADEKHRLEQACQKVAGAAAGEAETQWVFPEKFFDQLPDSPRRRASLARRGSALRADARGA